MHHCWICLRAIPDGQETKDHIIPNTKKTLRSSEWFWACAKCNNARRSIHFLKVEEFQKLLDELKPAWEPEDIRKMLRAYSK